MLKKDPCEFGVSHERREMQWSPPKPVLRQGDCTGGETLDWEPCGKKIVWV
jgi:hypothetical protein